jgi:transposase
MIQITPQMRILLAIEPVDFRKGIDGLAACVRQVLGTDPLAGALVVFRSRSRRALKLLVYDGQGFWLCQKRLSQGRFAWWPQPTAGQTLRVDPHQLHLLLWNGDPSRAHAAPLWRPVVLNG